ncbi:hypothetical protein [Neolewinella agarilytica]|uniref:Uncharacterized protein n=1 Tax=Neolewinella agarilytica TaxID=478744 RepID=A0A1H8ZAU9_9BACT|nr:hypothetical protein [Neolewinella agarilytica]SEP61560.1 hypothetical protein SAMN05444359_101249 [Neolewinella agarilytica]
MKQKNSFHLNTGGLISDLFSGIDPSVVDDNEYLQRIQENCQRQQNPFSCYLTLLLGEKPKVVWRHNTAAHFGLMNMQFEDIFTLVHPAWLFSYISYARAMYKLAAVYPELVNTEGASAASLIPMRHRSGKYYWYHQVSIRAAHDRGRLAAHLNYYHQSVEYGNQLPSMPKLTTKGMINPTMMAALKKEAENLAGPFMAEFLSDCQVKFMLEYRKLIHRNGGRKVSQGAILEQIPQLVNIENLNKYKQRVRLSARDYFKHPLIDSAYSLAKLLNQYYPLADEEIR